MEKRSLQIAYFDRKTSVRNLAEFGSGESMSLYTQYLPLKLLELLLWEQTCQFQGSGVSFTMQKLTSISQCLQTSGVLKLTCYWTFPVCSKVILLTFNLKNEKKNQLKIAT